MNCNRKTPNNRKSNNLSTGRTSCSIRNLVVLVIAFIFGGWIYLNLSVYNTHLNQTNDINSAQSPKKTPPPKSIGISMNPKMLTNSISPPQSSLSSSSFSDTINKESQIDKMKIKKKKYYHY